MVHIIALLVASAALFGFAFVSLVGSISMNIANIIVALQ